jgi:hypothetical protein
MSIDSTPPFTTTLFLPVFSNLILQVAWDVDTIYFSHDSHELALADFEHLDQRDLICIISALEHNTWFHKLTVSPNTTKLNSEVVDRILSVVAKSVSLQVPVPYPGILSACFQYGNFVGKLSLEFLTYEFCFCQKAAFF